MGTSWYEFRAERIEQGVREAGTPIDDTVLFEVWDDLVEDGSDLAFLVSEAYLPGFITAILDNSHPRDPRHGRWHERALTQVARHQDCRAVIQDLILERNDIIACIVDTKSYLVNDTYTGEFGDEYVSVEPLLDKLRPRIYEPGGGGNPLTDPDRCPECRANVPWWNYLAEHYDGCDLDERKEALQARRDHLVSAHLFCRKVGEALIAHTPRALDPAPRRSPPTSRRDAVSPTVNGSSTRRTSSRALRSRTSTSRSTRQTRPLSSPRSTQHLSTSRGRRPRYTNDRPQRFFLARGSAREWALTGVPRGE